MATRLRLTPRGGVAYYVQLEESERENNIVLM